jgi:hypothetical protein
VFPAFLDVKPRVTALEEEPYLPFAAIKPVLKGILAHFPAGASSFLVTDLTVAVGGLELHHISIRWARNAACSC